MTPSLKLLWNSNSAFKILWFLNICVKVFYGFSRCFLYILHLFFWLKPPCPLTPLIYVPCVREKHMSNRHFLCSLAHRRTYWVVDWLSVYRKHLLFSPLLFSLQHLFPVSPTGCDICVWSQQMWSRYFLCSLYHHRTKPVVVCDYHEHLMNHHQVLPLCFLLSVWRICLLGNLWCLLLVSERQNSC